MNESFAELNENFDEQVMERGFRWIGDMDSCGLQRGTRFLF
ncbi:MAG: hypothetical protein PHE53_03885 [Thermoguttaceae bacterium]|nr:hypothetical protein [Thermoguttaceae bacterium]